MRDRPWFAEPPEVVRETADEILRRPIYQPPEPGVIERAIDWLLEQLGRLVPDAGGPPVGGGGFLVGWVFLAVVAGLALYMLFKVMPRRLAKAETETIEVETTITHTTSRREWLDRAVEAEAEGRWRDAVRARYRALVAGLIDRNELPAETGATSGEYSATFGVEPPRGPAFGDATGRFEAVWYGGSAATGLDADALRAADEIVLTEERRR